ncbi:hypothetical protein [Saccharopolyspora sp.]|uniref:nSTAND1 domain-containing NTPase n=1 Tax=Saccharopolyspora sp. TaxID=33915 RepID=UPI00345CB6E3
MPRKRWPRQLWQNRFGGFLTHDAYQRIGGVQGALSRTADAVHQGLAPHPARPLAGRGRPVPARRPRVHRRGAQVPAARRPPGPALLDPRRPLTGSPAR